MPQIPHRPSPGEPEGGWMSPEGPGQWADLQELSATQLADEAARVASCGMSSCHRHDRCMYVNHPRGCKR